MQARTQWILDLIDGVTKPMKRILNSSKNAAKGVDKVGKNADNTTAKLKGLSAIDLFAINDAVQNIASQFRKINEPGAAFNASLKELEAISGVSGKALDELGDKGRATAKAFGGDASAMLNSYKGILGKLGPGIAQNDEALDMMGRSVATLSKTMSNDAVGSMNALTGSMLQFYSDVKDPMRMAELMAENMNIMAAASKEGSAEVPFITQSVKQAGTAAKNANIDFATTNAVIQALGKGAIYGSEAGIGLRNMLGKMAGTDVLPRAALEKIEALGINYDLVSDKSVPFVERLKELQKAQADATLITQIFGTENQNAVNTILNNITFIEELEGKIVGTTTATDQANIVMSGYNERMARMKTRLNDVAIGIFDVTSRLAPMMDGLAGSVSIFANMANARKGITLLFGTLKTMPVVGKLVAMGSGIASAGLGMVATAAKAVGVAIMNIPIIGWIAAAVAALVALGVHFWKTSETFRKVLMGVWEVLKTAFLGYYKFIWNILKSIWGLIKQVFNPKNWFNKNFSLVDAFKDSVKGVTDAAKEYGTSVMNAYGEGAAKGAASWTKDNPEETEKSAAGSLQSPVITPTVDDDPDVSPVIVPTNKQGGAIIPQRSGNKPKAQTGGLSLGGSSSGRGGGNTIHQKVEIKNIFNVAAGAGVAEIEAIADKISRAINSKLSDSVVIAGI